jgi:hypothetical protein
LEFISTSDIVHDVRWRNEEPRGHWSRDAQDQLHESTALSATLAHRALRNKKRSFVARRAWCAKTRTARAPSIVGFYYHPHVKTKDAF